MSSTTNVFDGANGKAVFSGATVALLGLMLVGLYTSLAVTLPNGIVVRGVGVLLPSLLLAAFHWKNLIRSPNQMLLMAWAIGGVATLGAVAQSADWAELSKSLFQMGASIFVFATIFSLVEKMDRLWIARISGVFCLLLLVGGFAEQFLGLAPISDGLRSVLYKNVWLYESVDRDIGLFGRRRPCVFTQEPSHVARFYALFLFAFCMSIKRHKMLLLTSGVGVGTVAFLSPSVSLAAGLMVSAVLCNELFMKRDLTKYAVSRPIRMALVLFGVLLVGGSTVAGVLWVFRDRVEAVLQGTEGSTAARLQAPALLVEYVARERPLLGFGVGAKEDVHEVYADILAGLIRGNADYIATHLDSYWSNAYCESWVFMGIVGGAAFWWLVSMRFRVYKNGAAAFFVLASVVIFNADSAFVSFRVWTYAGIVLGVYCSVFGRRLGDRDGTRPGVSIREVACT